MCVCVGVLQGYAVVPHKIIFNFLVTDLRCLQKSFTIGKKLCTRKNHKIVMEVWKAKPEMWASLVLALTSVMQFSIQVLLLKLAVLSSSIIQPTSFF